MDIEQLRLILNKVAQLAAKLNVNHTHVAKASGMSYAYLNMIKAGSRMKLDNSKNKKVIKVIINNYQAAINEQKRLMASVIQ